MQGALRFVTALCPLGIVSAYQIPIYRAVTITVILSTAKDLLRKTQKSSEILRLAALAQDDELIDDQFVKSEFTHIFQKPGCAEGHSLVFIPRRNRGNILKITEQTAWRWQRQL